ncbi:winged helix-turn-helix transcriptional regulator [Cuniculiplasma sp. SKW3]|uniref:winged helix-turn-helix transcriptional regulator n=1 Tax=Cuniculiplasma sp. SKW3 TaxID=3400170 RepID=UPI003FD063CB
MGTEAQIKDVNMTEISILLKLMKGENNFAEIARSLGITLQGVRYYVNILKQEGYIDDFKITNRGYEFLSSSLFQIRRFLNENSDFLSDANGWEVICDEDITSGDKVYLKMIKSYLHADKIPSSSSTAKSVTNSKKGERAIVRDIQGIIEIKFGRIEINLIKDLNSGNYEKYRKKCNQLYLNKGEKEIFILGEGSRTLFSDTERINMFAPLRGSFDASIRGTDSILVATEESFNLNLEEFSKLKEEFSKVEITMNFL